jgi:nucleotide-binding universal stress UspA family protein
MIPQIRKILYATDLTKNSSYAFYFAADLAQKHDAQIVILHYIASIQPQVYFEAGLTGDRILERAKTQEKKDDVAEIKKHLQEFCQKVEPQIGLPCVSLVSEVIVREGHPVEEILNAADAKRCDVIVLGTHGKGWLKQAFLGSVASSMLERTRRPVFIIPLPSDKTSVDWAAT